MAVQPRPLVPHLFGLRQLLRRPPYNSVGHADRYAGPADGHANPDRHTDPAAGRDKYPTPCTMAFTDVDIYNPFATYIRCLYCHGIVDGYADNTFRPYNHVTRSQVAKIVSNSAGYTDMPTTQTFTDVPASHLFYLFIERLASRGKLPATRAARGPTSRVTGSSGPTSAPTTT